MSAKNDSEQQYSFPNGMDDSLHYYLGSNWRLQKEHSSFIKQFGTAC